MIPPIAAAARSPDGVSQSGGEVVTLFATFPAIRQIFAEVLIAARHPVSERPEQPAGQGRERRVVILFLGTQQRIKVLASCAIANLQQALEMIDARAPDVDPLVGQPHDACDGALSHEDAVAKAKRPDRAVFAKREDDATFGI